jgi:hypothetical protein
MVSSTSPTPSGDPDQQGSSLGFVHFADARQMLAHAYAALAGCVGKMGPPGRLQNVQACQLAIDEGLSY